MLLIEMAGLSMDGMFDLWSIKANPPSILILGQAAASPGAKDLIFRKVSSRGILPHLPGMSDWLFGCVILNTSAPFISVRKTVRKILLTDHTAFSMWPCRIILGTGFGGKVPVSTRT